MNQRITAAHLRLLDDRQKEKLRSLWTPEEGDYAATGDHEEMIYFINGIDPRKALPLLTIGQMIAYLAEEGISPDMRQEDGQWSVSSSGVTVRDTDLCSALWTAMLHVL